MMTSSRRLAVLAVATGLALTAAACGSSAPSSSPAASVAASVGTSAAASTEPSTSTEPSASAPASTEPGASSEASAPADSGIPSFALPSFHEAPDLEAALPDKVGDQALQKLSFSGTGTFASGGSDSQDFVDLLTALGKSPSDFSLAVAGGDNVSIGVFRVAGVDGNLLLNAFVQAAQKDDTSTQVSDANRGGKSVKKVVSGSDTTYAYASGDKVFFVQSETDALVDQALSTLP